MWFSTTHLLLFSTLYSGIIAAPGTALAVRQNSDKEVLAAFAEKGWCMSYTHGGNRDKSLQPCKIFCEKKRTDAGEDPVGAYGCRGPSTDLSKEDKSLFSVDEDGNEWVPGDCECENAIAEVILDVVVKALAMLDNILCAVMISSFTTIAEIGVNFIPGGQAVTAVRYAVQGAKTFLENGLEAQSFFGDWVGKACGVPNWNFDLMSVFNPLTQMPDSLGVSIGCKKKNKGACNDVPKRDDPPPKKDDPKTEDPKKEDPKTDEPKKTNDPATKTDDSATKTNEPATATKTDDTSKTTNDPNTTNDPKTSDDPNKTSTDDKASSTTTDTNSSGSCKLKARPRDLKAGERIIGKLGEDEVNTDCGPGGASTVHVTKTTGTIGSYIKKDIPVTCRKENAQACYHYRSVMSVHAATPDMTAWTCQETPATQKDFPGKKNKKTNGVDGGATERWGKTAIQADILPKEQHYWPWANGFIPRTYLTNTDTGGVATKGCERDEFPPRYFWQGDDKAGKLVQRVRLNQWVHNSGGGKLWAGFCENNAAVHKGAGKAGKTTLRSSFINTVNSKVDPGKAGVGGTTTITSYVSVETARAVFSINDWDGLPEDKVWHGLKENECWNSAINPEDPGWALMTDDEFYQAGQHPELAIHTARYRQLPPLAAVQNAMPGGKAPFTASIIDAARYKAIFTKGSLPDAYRGVLPGIPLPPLPRRRHIFGRNATDPMGYNTTAPVGSNYTLPNGADLLGGISLADLDLAGISEDLEDLAADFAILAGPDVEWEKFDSDILELFLKNYHEVKAAIKRDEPAPTEPMQNDAQPTPLGQGDAIVAREPAIEGSIPTPGMPVPTQVYI